MTPPFTRSPGVTLGSGHPLGMILQNTLVQGRWERGRAGRTNSPALTSVQLVCPVSRTLGGGLFPAFRCLLPLPLLKVAQSCPTLCNHMGCSPPGSSVHGILQVRILEWVAFPFSRGSSQPRDQSQLSHTAGRFFTI